MNFAEKLNFLMDITKTSNSALAHNIALDASYISRLRTGKRLMPKDTSIVYGMSAFLTRRIKEDYQKKALSNVLNLKNVEGDSDSIANEIHFWLVSDQEDNTKRVERFLTGLSNIKSQPTEGLSNNDNLSTLPNEAINVYYGLEGKRKAAEHFLSEVIQNETPQTLLLFSDEETTWMTDDPAFTQKWAKLMFHVLACGNRIKIIHTISRDLDEMLTAINQWMPLYMSGSIEPYYYPKKRDGIFKKTLFIAPNTAAVISNSIGEQIQVAANILYRDPISIASFSEEFMHYIRLCRPLMRIFTDKERDDCYETIAEFERGTADTIIYTESLSLVTMPESLMDTIINQSAIDHTTAKQIHEDRRKRFQEGLSRNRFTEIITLPDVEVLKNRKVKVSMSEMMNNEVVYYAPSEFAEHLERILQLLENNENYYVHLVERQFEDRFTVYAREDLGVIVAKTSPPPVVLAINENNMTAAFWDYLKTLIGEKSLAKNEKQKSITLINDYLRKISN
ncbi:hypothetical protein [Macellibacteroides fermentans]|uniref:hypothetical protein n=1 Tax=Macellibacteroides fermentans TaxID=879969 RepID=UPI00406CC954